MRLRTNKSGEGLRNTTAAGLVPLLLLASVPSCGGWSVDPMPTWPKVQGVKPGTKTEVQLYKDKAPQGRQKNKGRFLSATEDSVTLELTGAHPHGFENPHVAENGCAQGADPSPVLEAMARMGRHFGYRWCRCTVSPQQRYDARRRFPRQPNWSVRPNFDPILHRITDGKNLRSPNPAQRFRVVGWLAGDQDQGAERFQVIRNFRHRDHSWPS